MISLNIVMDDWRATTDENGDFHELFIYHDDDYNEVRREYINGVFANSQIITRNLEMFDLWPEHFKVNYDPNLYRKS